MISYERDVRTECDPSWSLLLMFWLFRFSLLTCYVLVYQIPVSTNLWLSWMVSSNMCASEKPNWSTVS
jgi:hypothetical protein